MIETRILGTGSAVPQKVLTNLDRMISEVEKEPGGNTQ